jgi:hypothetical protein
MAGSVVAHWQARCWEPSWELYIWLTAADRKREIGFYIRFLKPPSPSPVTHTSSNKATPPNGSNPQIVYELVRKKANIWAWGEEGQLHSNHSNIWPALYQKLYKVLERATVAWSNPVYNSPSRWENEIRAFNLSYLVSQVSAVPPISQLTPCQNVATEFILFGFSGTQEGRVTYCYSKACIWWNTVAGNKIEPCQNKQAWNSLLNPRVLPFLPWSIFEFKS